MKSNSDKESALRQIIRGAGLVLIGTGFAMLFQFFTKMVIARHFLPSAYGTYSLAFVIFNMFLILSSLGITNGVPREIAYSLRTNSETLPHIIISALVIVSVSGVFFSMTLFFGANLLVTNLFDSTSLGKILRIMSLALAPQLLINILVSITRGFGSVKERVLFLNLLQPGIYLGFVILVTSLNIDFLALFTLYVISVLLVFVFFMFYLVTFRRNIFRRFLVSGDFSLYITKNLLRFSLPLLISSIVAYLLGWTDTLMLGHYLSSRDVGIYNAASPIAQLLTVMMVSAVYLYLPIATDIYAQGDIGGLNEIYKTITKFIFVLSVPMFLISMAFSKVVISYIFGSAYIGASKILLILSVGMIISVILGMNSTSLIVVGESKLNMFADLLAASLNFILNALLIPLFGGIGAAIATSSSLGSSRILRGYWLYKKSGLHPFSYSYLRLLGMFVITVVLAKVLAPSSIWAYLVLLTLYYVVGIVVGDININELKKVL